MTLLEERKKRISDSIELKEPDCVPITATGATFPVLEAGYTVAQVMYDFKKHADSLIKSLLKYEPDAASGGVMGAGMGPIFELIRSKTMAWAGAPDGRIPENSINQFIEFVVLQEEDMDFFKRDYTGWMITKGLPAVCELLEPLADWNFASEPLNSYTSTVFGAISAPASREMIKMIWKISDMTAELGKKSKDLNNKITELGFPINIGGHANVPFDSFSNFYRGTLDTMMDLYERPELIEHYIDWQIDAVLESITQQAKIAPGKWMFMPLHKGMDKFLTDEQYRDYYWKHLQRMIVHIIDVGMVPFVYTEGPYHSRLKYLSDVPKGKVVYGFEEVDPVAAKKELGGIACISGLFPSYLLHYGKKQQVIDEAKRLIDILAPGGGYILSTTAGIDNAIPENVEALYETVKTYGKR